MVLLLFHMSIVVFFLYLAATLLTPSALCPLLNPANYSDKWCRVTEGFLKQDFAEPVGTKLTSADLVGNVLIHRQSALEKCLNEVLGSMQQQRPNHIAVAAGAGWGKSAWADACIALLREKGCFVIPITWNCRTPFVRELEWDVKIRPQPQLDRTIVVRLAHALYEPNANFLEFVKTVPQTVTCGMVVKHVDQVIPPQTPIVVLMDECIKTRQFSGLKNAMQGAIQAIGKGSDIQSNRWRLILTSLAPSHLVVGGSETMKRVDEGGDPSNSDYSWVILERGEDEEDRILENLDWLREMSSATGTQQKAAARYRALGKFLLALSGGQWRARQHVWVNILPKPSQDGHPHLLQLTAEMAQKKVVDQTRELFPLRKPHPSETEWQYIKRRSRTMEAIGEFLVKTVVRQKVVLIVAAAPTDEENTTAVENTAADGIALVAGHTPGSWLIEGVLCNTMNPERPVNEVRFENSITENETYCHRCFF